MRTKSLSFAITTLLTTCLLFSCSSSDSFNPDKIYPDGFPSVRYLYGGGQENNGFQMWIWIYEDPNIPALVRSGKCRYIGNTFIDTDEERLTCRFTDTGFTLSDVTTGQVLYTATNVPVQYEPQHAYITITWSHSPGETWEKYAAELGWQREMKLCIQLPED